MTQTTVSNDTQTSIFNLPNNLTIARIVMIPLFIAIAYWPPALGIGVPMISDNAIANIGMNMDSFSDSMLRHLILTFLFIWRQLPIGWMAIWLQDEHSVGVWAFLDQWRTS